jgi:hypothetical protein
MSQAPYLDPEYLKNLSLPAALDLLPPAKSDSLKKLAEEIFDDKKCQAIKIQVQELITDLPPPLAKAIQDLIKDLCIGSLYIHDFKIRQRHDRQTQLTPTQLTYLKK